jgi:sulfatase maturation enzyme AslB (radical SAM superfamily)
MLNDVMHERCSTCHVLERNQKFSLDNVSNRVWYLKTLPEKDLNFFDNAKNFKLKMLDLRWYNTCNFACVYCGPDLSSAWASELNMPQRIDEQARKENLEYIYNNLDEVEHIYLAGGEPLLIKENIVLLTKMLEVNPNVDIRVNTNLSIINNPIYNLLKQFKNVHWTVSVDNIGEEFEYLRYGGKWDIFDKNLNQLKQDFEKINFNLVWCVLSGSGIFDCIDYLQSKGFHENTFIVNPLGGPLHWHVSNLDDVVLGDIREKIKNKLLGVNPKYSLYKSLSLMLNYIDEPHTKIIDMTIQELKKIDQRRNLDSTKIFKEVYHGKTI